MDKVVRGECEHLEQDGIWNVLGEPVAWRCRTCAAPLPLLPSDERIYLNVSEIREGEPIRLPDGRWYERGSDAWLPLA